MKYLLMFVNGTGVRADAENPVLRRTYHARPNKGPPTCRRPI